MKNAVVTGAGSGVGRATAIALLEKGWNVALIGRREEALKETASLAKECQAKALVCPGDIGDARQIEKIAQTVESELGPVEVLVNSAGTNIANRSFQNLSLQDYQRVLDTNLTGAYLCVRAFLPGMRKRKSGTIVNIVSEAGKTANNKAGASYIMSKFGMDGLTQAVNVEERVHRVRACSIYPGDINTPILDRRPVPPPPEIRVKMIQPEDVAACVLLVAEMPQRTTIEEMMVRPTEFTT